jgi:hypothetical protein
MNFDFKTIDWKVVIGALAFLATVFGFFYFQWWRNRKKLSYDILSNVVLVSAEKEIDDKIEIFYEGQRIKNVRLLVVKVVNDGYQPIKKDDFERPIRFVFPKGKLLTAERVKFHPENLGTEIGRGHNFVQIDPALFNRRDYVQFKALVNDYEEMRVDARIVGVSSLGKVKQFRGIWEFYLPVLVTMVFPILIMSVTDVISGRFVFPLMVSVAVLFLFLNYRLFKRN